MAHNVEKFAFECAREALNQCSGIEDVKGLIANGPLPMDLEAIVEIEPGGDAESLFTRVFINTCEAYLTRLRNVAPVRIDGESIKRYRERTASC